MNSVIEAMYKRRSVRSFLPQKIDREIVEELLKAAMAAPSACNRKPWFFVPVDEEVPLARLKRAVAFGRYNALTAIVVCGDMRKALPLQFRDYWVQDCSAAMENILVAATSLGLGAVWIGNHPVKKTMAAVSRALHLPKHLIPMGTVMLGYPAEVPEPRTQYQPDRVCWQGFDPPKRGYKDGLDELEGETERPPREV